MTGTLETYLTKWNLSDPKELAQTFTSAVYLVRRGNEQAVLKLLNETGIEDETNGALALKYFNGQGATFLLEQDGAAHLLEYAGSGSLKELVETGQDEIATRLIGKTLNKLHGACGPIPDGLMPLEERFHSLFARAAKEKSGSIFQQAAETARQLLATKADETVLHGDMHHENILESHRGWLAIDPKGLYGERTFDACNALQNPHLPEIVLDKTTYIKRVETLSSIMKLDTSRLIEFSFAFSCLSACWCLEDDLDASLPLGVAHIAQELL